MDENIPDSAAPRAETSKPDQPANYLPVTRDQILAGFDPPPGPQAGEEERRRYWDAYYEKRRSFHENRYRHPPEQIQPYRGKGLAWSPDGTRILAVGPDSCSLQVQINALGFEALLLAYEDVPEADEVRA